MESYQTIASKLGGAIDAMPAEKASEFLTLCDEHNIPIVSMVDTPGFMVGPESEEESLQSLDEQTFENGSQIVCAPGSYLPQKSMYRVARL